MQGLEEYSILWVAANIVGLLFIYAAWKSPKSARIMFALLFGWALVVNLTTAHTVPEAYLNYAPMAIKLYGWFILGPFSEYITEIVSMIALLQGLIAFFMLLNAYWVKLACLGSIFFLLAIAPLGVGAGFPFSITVSLAAAIILKKDDLSGIWDWFKVKSYA